MSEITFLCTNCRHLVITDMINAGRTSACSHCRVVCGVPIPLVVPTSDQPVKLPVGDRLIFPILNSTILKKKYSVLVLTFNEAILSGPDYLVVRHRDSAKNVSAFGHFATVLNLRAEVGRHGRRAVTSWLSQGESEDELVRKSAFGWLLRNVLLRTVVLVVGILGTAVSTVAMAIVCANSRGNNPIAVWVIVLCLLGLFGASMKVSAEAMSFWRIRRITPFASLLQAVRGGNGVTPSELKPWWIPDIKVLMVVYLLLIAGLAIWGLAVAINLVPREPHGIVLAVTTIFALTGLPALCAAFLWSVNEV